MHVSSKAQSLYATQDFTAPTTELVDAERIDDTVEVDSGKGMAVSESRSENRNSTDDRVVGIAVSRRKDADDVTCVRRVDGTVDIGRRVVANVVDIMIKDWICSYNCAWNNGRVCPI